MRSLLRFCGCFLLLAFISASLSARPPRPAAAGALAAPTLGPAHAAVQVTVFQDLECPSCAQWHIQMSASTFSRYRSRVHFVFHDYPLAQHAWAFNAAVLERFFATRDARLYFGWQDYCFRHQNELSIDNLVDKAAAWAAPYGIPRAAIAGAFARNDLFTAVENDRELGDAAGVKHTPTVLVNVHGEGSVEASSPEQLNAMIEAGLKRR